MNKSEELTEKFKPGNLLIWVTEDEYSMVRGWKFDPYQENIPHREQFFHNINDWILVVESENRGYGQMFVKVLTNHGPFCDIEQTNYDLYRNTTIVEQ